MCLYIISMSGQFGFLRCVSRNGLMTKMTSHKSFAFTFFCDVIACMHGSEESVCVWAAADTLTRKEKRVSTGDGDVDKTWAPSLSLFHHFIYIYFIFFCSPMFLFRSCVLRPELCEQRGGKLISRTIKPNFCIFRVYFSAVKHTHTHTHPLGIACIHRIWLLCVRLGCRRRPSSSNILHSYLSAHLFILFRLSLASLDGAISFHISTRCDRARLTHWCERERLVDDDGYSQWCHTATQKNH